ncbi:glycine zipper 2TM domain-containing protein [Nitratifractor salsuginis]|uniref:17 kDa surface antigen n=1 Tax=Nitratifractor salsuginis (strain DSM 16511 / JCM 12458 / E9I37-1) TaxID=749222 RepID=E6X309_NITSE|nr:glycine zipper 2TM domain-containing protein [Nitratifractor salsuginis]ADV46153.1 17 kDa surface antigen [Nitratifractor salsuginis DSM 16511]
MKKLFLLSLLAFGSIYAGSFSWYRDVPVIRSKPVYETVTIRKPYEVCYNRQVPVYRNGIEEPVAALLGGAAGGVLGHQIGKGRGRTAATIGGAVVGAFVGDNLARRQRRVYYRPHRVCETRYRVHGERQLVHYRNVARFHGRRIVKFSSRPLRYIRIKITASY